MKKIGILMLFATLFVGCKTDEEHYRTFTGDMVYSFLKKDSIYHYSEFVKVVEKAGLKGMLSAYGEYTCLAPTDDAFKAYYKSFGPKFNSDSLTKEQAEYIAKTHIIGRKHLTIDLRDGVIPSVNMKQRYIEIRFAEDTIKNTLEILLNDSARIVSRDNEVYNGVIQGINRVLKPSEALLPELIANNPKLSIFAAALKKTGLADSLLLLEDKTFVPIDGFIKGDHDNNSLCPRTRKFAYTAFVETDSLFNAEGIKDLDELIAAANQWYPSGKGYENDFTNRNNSLNQFVAYHLVEKMINSNQFVFTSHAVRGFNAYEFIETLLPNRIMKIDDSGTEINGNSVYVINPGSGDATVSVLKTGSKVTLNGVYHSLSKILVYNDKVEKMLTNTRIRFDVASLFPELMNNNLRCSRAKIGTPSCDRYFIPNNYMKYIKASKDTKLFYLAGDDESNWIDYQSDELMGLGLYDVTYRLLPVPPGTYEVRFGYSANTERGIAQIYFDKKPVGIPLNLTITAEKPQIGWLSDDVAAKDGDVGGYENDKMMRNRGYMKGPITFSAKGGSGYVTARNSQGALRRIVGTFKFDKHEAHTIRFKTVTENPKGELMMDYFEFVPKSVSNPSSGEPESRE